MARKQRFDVGIIVPLEEELEQVFEIFPAKEDLSTDLLQVHSVQTGDAEITAVVVKCPEMGRSAARTATRHCLERFEISLIVCIGIAGGLSKDLSLGDVCYSTEVIDISENQKVSDAKGGGVELALSSKTHHTDEKITFAVNCSRAHPKYQNKYRAWQDRQTAKASSRVSSEVDGGRGPEGFEKPIALHGPIACGAVSRSSVYNDYLSKIHRNTLAIETESGEVFVEAKLAGVPALTVRGISDYANVKKSALEKNSKGAVRSIAASNAASFLKLQFKNQFFLAQLKRQRAGEQRNFDFSTRFDNDVSEIDRTVRDIACEIDRELRELSPEYRLQEKGYRLPAPRLRRVELVRTKDTVEPSEPELFHTVISSETRIAVSLPRSYPDRSLPWVFGLELLTTVLHDKQTVPIIIDGSRVSPPKWGLERLGGKPLEVFANRDSFKVIFIIENPPLSSKTKLRFLLDELDKYPDANVIFLFARADGAVDRANFLSTNNVSCYEICEVSFLQIAHFLERNHDMEAAEAQVIALRLRDIFDGFALDAHPTYFAGIAKEVLTALLAANRRSELIQLAVDGFLTFLVAGDPSPIALTRTTRAKFLKEIAFRTKVEKRRMTRSDVVSYAEDFARKYDYEINPLDFVHQFEEQGIISFDDAGIEFILPFVEHYLLAQTLRERTGQALQYFDADAEDFDVSTFDLYAEMGPSKEIRSDVVGRLRGVEKELSSLQGERHILLTNDLQPAFLSAMERVARMEKALKSAADAVREDKDAGADKQRLLDMRDRVQSKLANRTSREPVKTDSQFEIEESLRKAFRIWHVGVTLLGSGAEHLEADEKRTLVALLLRVGAQITDIWTRQRAEFDLEDFRKEITSDETIDFFESTADKKLDRKVMRETLNSIVDMVEGVMLSQPSYIVYDTLCERAREKVLSVSIDAVKVDHEIEELMQALWLADLDASKAKVRLSRLNRDLPAFSFLRMTTAMHCMMRTYWRHWNKSDRLLLLDVASNLLSPLSVGLNKGAMMRRIAKDDDKL